MHRAQPVISKIVARKWDESQHEAHQQRLNNIKATMKITPAPYFRYLEERPKKKQLEEGKFQSK